MKFINNVQFRALLLLWPVIAINGSLVQTKTESGELVNSVLLQPVREYKSPVFNFLYPPGLSVQEIVELQSKEWHWHPWKHMRLAFNENGEEEEEECEVTSSLDDLPDDLFTRKQCPFCVIPHQT